MWISKIVGLSIEKMKNAVESAVFVIGQVVQTGARNLRSINLKNTKDKVIDYTSVIFDTAIEKWVHLGRGLPATRDFTNFSSDPDFWKQILINNLRSDLREYRTSKNQIQLLEQFDHYIVGSFKGKVLVNPNIVISLISKAISALPDQEFQANALQFVFRTINECQIEWLLQAKSIKKLAVVRFSFNALSENVLNLGKILLIGAVFASRFSLANARLSGSPDCNLQCQQLQKDLNNRVFVFYQVDNRFSLAKWLHFNDRCDYSLGPCYFPGWLYPFDCATTDLRMIDFSNIQGNYVKFIGTPSSVCNLFGAKIENTTIENFETNYADFTNAIVRNTRFKGTKLNNSLFDEIEGEGSFEDLEATNTSFINLNGKFGFPGAKLRNVNMGRKIPSNSDCTFKKNIEIDVTGAQIDQVGFETTFPKYLKTAFNITSKIIANPNLEGTVFNNCSFGLKNDNDMGWWSCSSKIIQIFNLTDTRISGTYEEASTPPCSGNLLDHKGHFKNVSFSENFSFSGQCSEVFLSNVDACGFDQLREANYPCLTQQCDQVEIENSSPPTKKQQFEDFLIFRNESMLNQGLLSINKVLKYLNLCPINASFCTLPSEFSEFNCHYLNWKKVDFSNLYANGIVMISNGAKAQCSVNEGNFDGAHFENATLKDIDASNSKISGTIIEKSRVSGNFNSLNGNISFAKSIVENSSFDEFSGEIDFTRARLINSTFRYMIWDGQTFIRSAEYTFTGAVVDQSEFSVTYSNGIWSTINEIFTFIAKADSQGTLFNNTRFNTNGKNYNCISRVTWLFNLTDTRIENTAINVDNGFCYQAPSAIFLGGQLKNVTASKGFQFPVNNAYVGCTDFTLNNVIVV